MTLHEIANVVTAAIDERRKARIAEIRVKEKVFFDKLKRIGLKDAQIEGVEWLSATYDLGLSCILGDGMGFGKTAQSIFFLFRLRSIGVNGPFLIAVPSNVLASWTNELNDWSSRWLQHIGEYARFNVYT